MTTTELLQEGLHLMALGMGSVFVFLSLLVLSMHLTASLVRRLESRTTRETPAESAHQTAGTPLSPEVVAAIGIAIQRFRKTHTSAH